MLNALASAFFYARFMHSFSRTGYVRRARGFDRASFDFRGQLWVVSGCTGGIGRAIALGALAAGARVIGLARDPAKLATFACDAGLEGEGRLETQAVDLSCVAAISRAVPAIAACGRVDVLVNNVGLMLHDFHRTPEGVEASFATNLLGHFALTEGLVDAGALVADSAIISMSSGGMYGARLDLQRLEAADADSHDGLAAYAQHKRAQVELTRYWNRGGTGRPRAWVMHPGWVDTDGVRSALPMFRRVLRRYLRSAGEGADTALWLAATRPETPVQGGIWLDREIHPEHTFGFTRGGASDAGLAEWLRGRLSRLGASR